MSLGEVYGLLVILLILMIIFSLLAMKLLYFNMTNYERQDVHNLYSSFFVIF